LWSRQGFVYTSIYHRQRQMRKTREKKVCSKIRKRWIMGKEEKRKEMVEGGMGKTAYAMGGEDSKEGQSAQREEEQAQSQMVFQDTTFMKCVQTGPIQIRSSPRQNRLSQDQSTGVPVLLAR
jgi:hypothetical protein